MSRQSSSQHVHKVGDDSLAEGNSDGTRSSHFLTEASNSYCHFWSSLESIQGLHSKQTVNIVAHLW